MNNLSYNNYSKTILLNFFIGWKKLILIFIFLNFITLIVLYFFKPSLSETTVVYNEMQDLAKVDKKFDREYFRNLLNIQLLSGTIEIQNKKFFFHDIFQIKFPTRSNRFYLFSFMKYKFNGNEYENALNNFLLKSFKKIQNDIMQEIEFEDKRRLDEYISNKNYISTINYNAKKYRLEFLTGHLKIAEDLNISSKNTTVIKPFSENYYLMGIQFITKEIELLKHNENYFIVTDMNFYKNISALSKTTKYDSIKHLIEKVDKHSFFLSSENLNKTNEIKILYHLIASLFSFMIYFIYITIIFFISKRNNQ